MMIEAASQMGACRVGEYENVASYYEVKGCFKPSESSNPYEGKKNEINYGTEYKLELRCEESLVRDLITTIRRLHPYEEALINVIQLSNHLFE